MWRELRESERAKAVDRATQQEATATFRRKTNEFRHNLLGVLGDMREVLQVGF